MNYAFQAYDSYCASHGVFACGKYDIIMYTIRGNDSGGENSEKDSDHGV